MQATRQQIVQHLRITRGATVKQLCALLDLTPTGVRQHLTILEQEGLVESEEVRGKVGRPALRYCLTRRGDSIFPKSYDDLANALIDEIRSLYGAEGLQRVARGVATRLAGDEVEQLERQTSTERVEAVVRLFEQRGIVADWEREGDIFLLHERTCPFPEVAQRNPISCAMEVAQVQQLTGMDARLQSCVLRGDECCTYRLVPHDGARVASR